MKNSWAGKTLVLSFGFLVKYFSSGGPWEGYTAISKSKGCLSAGSKSKRNFTGYMWPCQHIFTGQRCLQHHSLSLQCKSNTTMPVRLRTECSQHRSVHNVGTKMVQLLSRNAEHTSPCKWSRRALVLTSRLRGNCQPRTLHQDTVPSKTSLLRWEGGSHCGWHGFWNI